MAFPCIYNYCNCECRESLFSTLLFLLMHVEIVTRADSFLYSSLALTTFHVVVCDQIVLWVSDIFVLLNRSPLC